MMRSDADIRIARPIEAVYAFIDDFSQATRWLEGCLSLSQIDPGARRIGARLHYSFKQGGRVGSMDGIVTTSDPPRQLALGFTSAPFEVAVDFALVRDGAGTAVKHGIAITPRNIFGKLMSPLIRMGNQKQVRANLARLKALCEGASAGA